MIDATGPLPGAVGLALGAVRKGYRHHLSDRGLAREVAIDLHR